MSAVYLPLLFHCFILLFSPVWVGLLPGFCLIACLVTGSCLIVVLQERSLVCVWLWCLIPYVLFDSDQSSDLECYADIWIAWFYTVLAWDWSHSCFIVACLVCVMSIPCVLSAFLCVNCLILAWSSDVYQMLVLILPVYCIVLLLHSSYFVFMFFVSNVGLVLE